MLETESLSRQGLSIVLSIELFCNDGNVLYLCSLTGQLLATNSYRILEMW